MATINKAQVATLLDRKYPLLGDLTQSEFIALKYHMSMDKQITTVNKIDPNSIVVQNAMGGWDRVAITSVRPHDNIRVTMSINRNGQLQTGTFLVENVKSAKFNPATGYTMIETDNKAITDQPDIKRDFELFIAQMEQNPDVRILGQLIANGQVAMQLVGSEGFKQGILYGDIEFSDVQQMIGRAQQSQSRIAEMMLGDMGAAPMHDGFTNAWDRQAMRAEEELRKDEKEKAESLGRIHSEIAELDIL